MTQIIGVAGCGSMGLPMARRLLQAGFQVYGYDIRPMAEFGDFRSRMISAATGFSQLVDVVISVVRDETQTLSLCFGDQALFSRNDYPHILVVSSTLSPRFINQLRKRLPADVELIDAPMSGAPIAAEQGQLSFMIGGDELVVDALMPLFQAMGGQINHLGALGQGMTYKVLNNYVAACSVAAVRRVMTMARALNVDTRQLRGVMEHSSGSTWYGNRFDQISWSRQGYDLDNTIAILEKDVNAALDAVCIYPEIAHNPLDDALLDALRSLEPWH